MLVGRRTLRGLGVILSMPHGDVHPKHGPCVARRPGPRAYRAPAAGANASSDTPGTVSDLQSHTPQCSGSLLSFRLISTPSTRKPALGLHLAAALETAVKPHRRHHRVSLWYPPPSSPRRALPTETALPAVRRRPGARLPAVVSRCQTDRRQTWSARSCCTPTLTTPSWSAPCTDATAAGSSSN